MDEYEQSLLEQLLQNQKKVAEQTQSVGASQQTPRTRSSLKGKSLRLRTAIIRRDSAAKLRVPLERGLAVLLLLISFSGAILWGGGGWTAWVHWQVNIYGAAAVFVVQCLCTAFQYAYAKDWYKSIRWWIVLGISTTTTVLGFLPLAQSYFTQHFAEMGIPTTFAPILSMISIIILAALIDFIPERMLLD